MSEANVQWDSDYSRRAPPFLFLDPQKNRTNDRTSRLTRQGVDVIFRNFTKGLMWQQKLDFIWTNFSSLNFLQLQLSDLGVTEARSSRELIKR